MAATNGVYVITGANRGIGLGLFASYLSRPSTTVVGIVRSNESAASLELAAQKATKGADSTYRVVILEFSKAVSPDSAFKEFISATDNAIEYVNTLICSAGHVGALQPALTMTPADLRESFEVNTIGPLVAFQALWPLLQKASAATSTPPKFIVLSSSLGSIGEMEPLPGGGYGPSKAAVNHIVKSIHSQMEQTGLIAVALHPGWVQTAMGYSAAEQWSYTPGPPDTVEDSVQGILNVVDGATRENVSGKFVSQKGDILVW